MKLKRNLLGIGLAVTAALGIASPASAQTLCFGPSSMYVCANPTGGTPISECVYAGPPPCHPVTAPTPAVWCDGNWSCRITDIFSW